VHDPEGSHYGNFGKPSTCHCEPKAKQSQQDSRGGKCQYEAHSGLLEIHDNQTKAKKVDF